MVEIPMSAHGEPGIPGALELAEQAVRLLRQRGGVALACYYIGSLPFLMGLVYFWSDMSRDPAAASYCAPAAAGVAILFVWMKVWQVRFCRLLWAALVGAAPEPWTWRRTFFTTVRQALLQSTGALILPLASVILLPLAWTYAFYQNLSVMDGPDTESFSDLYRDSLSQAFLWSGANHVLLSLLSAFGLFVFANVAIGVIALPYLLKGLLGIETAFTTGGLYAVTNTTFLAVVCALTYLCMDPVIKAAYTLRCFYGRSRRTGEDLRAALRPFLLVVLLVAAMLGGSAVRSAAAQPVPSSRLASPSVTVMERWNKAMDRVLAQRRFAWRMPREKAAETPGERQGWFWSTLRWLKEKIGAAIQAVIDWVDAFSRWLRKFLPEGKGAAGTGTDWDMIIRLVFYLTGGGLLVLLLVSIRNRLRHGRIQGPASGDVTSATVVDLNDENLTADELPLDRWLALAREMMAARELRQALRAYYLSLLALLGDEDRIVIARYKSNRDYRRELSRRSHAEPDLLNLFDRCVAAFEAAWYGMHPVAEEQLSGFISDQERISLLVHPKAAP
jgi:Domain of unknown function (DUF4129)